MPWDPERYFQFKKERYAPFEDLIRMVKVRPGLRVIDLGCGPGELTARLADSLPDSDVVGIDNSPQMLERAIPLARKGLRFELRAIEDLEGDYDLVFSHAALHWVKDHESTIPRFFSHVRPGGQMIVQMPSNQDHPVMSLIREIASTSPYADAATRKGAESFVLPLQNYAEMLYRSGGKELNIIEKIYPHVMENSDALADWTSGTALVPFMERLPQPLHDPFMAEYRKRLKQLYPGSPVFFGFKRILFSVTK